MIGPLTTRQREVVHFAATYGRLYGEGVAVMATTAHRWPRNATLADAQAMRRDVAFAEDEARARREVDDAGGHGRHVLCLGPHGLWQVFV